MNGPLVKAENKKLSQFSEDKERTWNGPFTFIQAADTQFGMIEGYVEGKAIPGWSQEIALTKHTVRIVNNMRPKPRFFIVCGDLVHAFPGEINRERQESDLKEILSDLDPDIPAICVCGNHDIGNTPTEESIQQYRDVWGDDYFTFWVGGVKFIVINSQFYADRSLVEDLGRSHDEWFMNELHRGKTSGAKHLILFQHIPWFLKDPDEEDEYFNVDKRIRNDWLRRISDAGVSKIFCGHYHRNAGGWYRSHHEEGHTSGVDMELVVTSAIGAQLGDDGSGFRVVSVTDNPGGVTHKYHRIQDYPQYADPNNDSTGD